MKTRVRYSGGVGGWRAGLAAILLLTSPLAPPGVAAQGLEDPSRAPGELLLRLVLDAAGRAASVSCDGSGSFDRACVEDPIGGHSLGVLAVHVTPRPLRFAFLFEMLGHLSPVGTARAYSPETRDNATIQLRFHWGADKEPSWVEACVWTADHDRACALRDAAVDPVALSPEAVLRIVDALQRLAPVAPTEPDALRALDAALATLPSPAGPEPGDVVGTSVLDLPAEPDDAWTDPLVFSSWNTSGGLADLEVEVASPTMQDVLPDRLAASERTEARRQGVENRTGTALVEARAPARPAERGNAGADAAAPPKAMRRVSGAEERAAPRTHAVSAAPAPSASGAVALAGLAVAGALALLLAADVLFARLRDGALGDQRTRGRILDALRSRPGQTARDLAAALRLHPSTVRYHLRVMTKASYVKVRKTRGRDLHFLAETTGHAPVAGPARAVYDAVASHPGLRVRDLCALVGTHRTTIHYHVRALQAAGLLVAQREGNRLRLFTAPRTGSPSA